MNIKCLPLDTTISEKYFLTSNKKQPLNYMPFDLSVIDGDELGAEGIKSVIENTKYPNYCISPKVEEIDEGIDIPEET